jgi:hypothetical protein
MKKKCMQKNAAAGDQLCAAQWIPQLRRWAHSKSLTWPCGNFISDPSCPSCSVVSGIFLDASRTPGFQPRLVQEGNEAPGEYSDNSVVDVADNDGLHTLLSGLPLFPYRTIKVTPLAKHLSAVE